MKIRKKKLLRITVGPVDLGYMRAGLVKTVLNKPAISKSFAPLALH